MFGIGFLWLSPLELQWQLGMAPSVDFNRLIISRFRPKKQHVSSDLITEINGLLVWLANNSVDKGKIKKEKVGKFEFILSTESGDWKLMFFW